MPKIALATPIGEITLVAEDAALTGIRFGRCGADEPVAQIPVTALVADALGVEATGDADDVDAFASAVTTTLGTGSGPAAHLADDPANARVLCDAAVQIGDYFNATRRHFALPLAYPRGERLRDRAQRFLPLIGYGKTATYGQIAERLGSPKAARAVGTACAKNPLPLVVPCHRVLPAGGDPEGNIGGYAGGPAAKRALLRLERVR